MDGDRFDAIARALGTTSRRRAARAALGGAHLPAVERRLELGEQLALRARELRPPFCGHCRKCLDPLTQL